MATGPSTFPTLVALSVRPSFRRAWQPRSTTSAADGAASFGISVGSDIDFSTFFVSFGRAWDATVDRSISMSNYSRIGGVLALYFLFARRRADTAKQVH